MRTRRNAGPLACALLVLLSACMKDELPVPKRPRGGAVEGRACIGADYAGQSWYDIGSNTVVSSNSKLAWDLAFECGAEGWRVRLNTSRFMRAYRTTGTDITQPVDTAGFGAGWRIDLPGGAPDSTAIGDWRTEHPVFVIDLGYDVIGLPLGLRKLRVTGGTSSGFQFELAQLNGTGVQAFTVQKDPARSHVHFSIISGQAVTIAPPHGTYDLVFTQYTTQFYDPYQAYLVTGAIGGFSGVRVAELTGDFAAVTLADTLAHPFSTEEDAVGYDWKEYSFQTSSYVIHPDRVFIVQDVEGYFYKLHFVDFYDEQGQRGCPQFEVVAL